MLRTIRELEGYAIGATDGIIGHVVDALVDDTDWTVRWLVVKTGHWLSSRRVLISPMSIGVPNRHDKALPVSITREQVRHAPALDTALPFGRDHETDLFVHYDHAAYWEDTGLWGADPYANVDLFFGGPHRPEPLAYGGGDPSDPSDIAPSDAADTHLHGANALFACRLHATDGDIGHVRNLFVQEGTWSVRYLVIETGHWWHGHSVLIPPAWIETADTDTGEIRIDRARRSVREAPEHDPGTPMDAATERWLRDRFESVHGQEA